MRVYEGVGGASRALTRRGEGLNNLIFSSSAKAINVSKFQMIGALND